MNGDSGIPDGGNTDAGHLDAGPGATGATCTTPAQCLGSNRTCSTMLATHPAPAGYCTGACVFDLDCPDGFCIGGPNPICLENCSGANQCQARSADNRCFHWDSSRDACLPSDFSQCDPTTSNSCASHLCNRAGPDNVGTCMTSCTFGSTCPADAQGNPQQCLLFNEKVDFSGFATHDVSLGLACLPSGAGLAIGAACAYLNDCVSGAECNFYMGGGKGRVCATLCRNGQTDCNGTGGACQDAFLLTKSGDWGAGAIGLCL
jgi:hypothetical protein